MNSIRIRRRYKLPAECFAYGLAVACLLAGCKAPELPAIIAPYRIDIQQGNVITQAMISKLKAGMTRSQVRFVLGSPLIVDPFRTDRWDYVSIYEKQGKEVERRRVTVIFEQDKLVRIEGDVVVGDGALKKDVAVEIPPAAGKVEPDSAKAATFSKPAAVPAPAATPVEKPTVADKVMLDPAKPVTFSKPPVMEPAKAPATAPEKPVVIDVPAADAPKPAAGPEVTGDAAAATPAPPAAAEKKVDAVKKDETKDQPKQPGFFGRILEKMGI